jgi:hypothetical protein
MRNVIHESARSDSIVADEPLVVDFCNTIPQEGRDCHVYEYMLRPTFLSADCRYGLAEMELVRGQRSALSPNNFSCACAKRV